MSDRVEGYSEGDNIYVPNWIIRDPALRSAIGVGLWVYLGTLADPDFTVKSLSQELDWYPARIRLHLRRLAKYGIIKYQKAFAKQDSKEVIPRKLRWEVWERDDFTCKHCGTRQDLTIDHIIPEHKGGTLDPENLQTLCRSCNSKKGIKQNEQVIDK